MAQQTRRPQQSRNTGRSQADMSSSEDMDSDDDQSSARAQSTRGQAQQQQPRSQKAGGRRELQAQDNQQEGGANDILSAITPAFQEARTYIEGSPVRAAAIGAIAGGLLMTLFSTEKGRGFVKLAYDYANPMVAKYAREYISNAAGNMADSALSQH